MQIELGALSEPLTDQLGRNIKLTPEQRKEAGIYDKDADAISRLYIRGLIPESQADNARRKLLKKIERLLDEVLPRKERDAVTAATQQGHES